MANYNAKFIINFGLLLSGLSASVSGIVIQVGYHIGNHGMTELNKLVLGIGYQLWTDIHKLTIVIFTLLMIFHFALHLNWYKTVFKNKRITKNMQLITFSALFLLVAITGFIPWFTSLFNDTDTIRKALIEVHDKLALIFFVYMILHVLKRLKWFHRSLISMK